MNTDAQVMPQAVEYFRYYFLGVLATVLYNMCTSILNALGDSRRPLHYLIISSLVNIALDLLFIGAFRWGVWSAAVATVLSQGTSCVLCLIHLLKKGEVYTVTPRNIRFHTGMLGEIVRYGLPSGIQNCVIGLANVIVQSQINSFGMLAMAAYGAHCKIEGFAFLPITSFTMACTTFVGQNLGAKQYDRAKRGARFCIIIAVVMAELIGLCYYIWASQLISLFDSTPGVVALGVQQARTVALFYCLLAFSHSIAAVCRGAGRALLRRIHWPFHGAAQDLPSPHPAPVPKVNHHPVRHPHHLHHARRPLHRRDRLHLLGVSPHLGDQLHHLSHLLPAL